MFKKNDIFILLLFVSLIFFGATSKVFAGADQIKETKHFIIHYDTSFNVDTAMGKITKYNELNTYYENARKVLAKDYKQTKQLYMYGLMVGDKEFIAEYIEQIYNQYDKNGYKLPKGKMDVYLKLGAEDAS